MARSIRLRLLAWCAAVLAGVVGGFAGILYQQVRAARLRDADAGLETAAAGLDAALRLFPPHELSGEGPPPPPDRDDPRDLTGPMPLPERAPGSAPGPHRDRRPPGRARLLESLSFPGPPGSFAGAAYFAVWRADGSLLKAADLPPETDRPESPLRRPTALTRGSNREVVSLGPGRTVLLVGRPCERVFAELRAFAWLLAGTGALVLAVGLTGVWLVSRRVFRPVNAISDAASRISADNLSGRIDTEALDAELVGLGRVLNETFARLEAAFERQARFTADASHELRTPLAIVRTSAELALSRPREEEDYRDALRACLRAAERMAGLVERLLTLARADAGWPGMKREPVDFGRVVREVVAQFAPAAAGKGVSVTTDLARVRVVGDEETLARLCVNLLANAIEYNRPGGHVAVRLEEGKREVTLTVADTGIGIPDADRPRLFERFYRADKARSRASGGTGLGLAICKAIAEAHGGTITSAPTPGGGCTFRVTLPGEADAPRQNEGAANQRPLSAPNP
jgi:heavy metal sensor kinase